MPFLLPNTDVAALLLDPPVKELYAKLTTARTGITALAGGGQAGTVHILTAAINRITTVGSAADSVKLPPAVPGVSLVVINAAATNSMNVFPNTGDYINALGQNAALAVAANKTVLLFCAVAGTWNSIVTA